MITESDMYWLTRLDHISTALSLLILITSIAMPVAFIICLSIHADGNHYDPRTASIVNDSPFKPPLKTIAGIGVIFVLSWAAYVLTPTTKEMCAIKIVPMIANNKDLQGVGNDFVELARDWMKELRPKLEKETSK